MTAVRFLSLILLSTVACSAEDKFPYGTGMLSELPHERGELIKGFTGAGFPVTTKDKTAGLFFQQGLTQLWFGTKREAARSFREVITRDPDCAMGYWGIALSAEPDKSRCIEYMWYAFQRRSKASEFESKLIHAYAEFYGATEKPEMVLVDSETGKRRARPRVLTSDEVLTAFNLLGSSLEQIDSDEMKFWFNPMNRWAQLPATPQLIQIGKTWGDGMRFRGFPGVWSKLGLANADNPSDGLLAWETACRVDNGLLTKWDAMPYEREGYLTRRYRIGGKLIETEKFNQEVTRLPRHPGVREKLRRVRHSAFPDDWRAQTSATVGQQRILRSLGPLDWVPPAAPDFLLASSRRDVAVGLKNLKGPTIVVFYLGFGCIHCVEQLNELRPRYKDFKEAGIEIVAIGTDDVNEVKAAILDAIEVDGPATPFEILSDPKGDAFKAFHCWDEFKDEALHGTFLIDAAGRVRWRDISEEPFMETDFLLEESKRLLALPQP